MFDGPNAPGLPERTFSDTLTLGHGADRVELHYFGRAHTSGDAWVVFPALGVMHAGDAFPGKSLPIMDSSNGGSGLDYPDTVRKAAQGVSGVDRVITGHSTVLSHADLSEYADFVGAFVSDARSAKSEGNVCRRLCFQLAGPAQILGLRQGTRGATASLRGRHLRRAALACLVRSTSGMDLGAWALTSLRCRPRSARRCPCHRRRRRPSFVLIHLSTQRRRRVLLRGTREARPEHRRPYRSRDLLGGFE